MSVTNFMYSYGERRSIINIYRDILIACTLIAATISNTAHAQSIDRCLEASNSEAINICQSMIDNGSRNANVYWKLASALYQNEKTDEAKIVLKKARSLHPSDKDLKTLTNLISSAETEKTQLKESATKNQQMASQGSLKIACLTKTGDVGITACEDYLSTTGSSEERFVQRLASLQSSVKPKQTPAPNDSTETPQPTQKIESATIATRPTTTADAPSRKPARSNTVLTAQQLLNDLGFNTGRPDGLAGARTRNALAMFYTELGVVNNNPDINLSTLEDLQIASGNFSTAQQLLADSKQAEAQGEFTLALSRLDEAGATSALLDMPQGYRSGLMTSLAAVDAAIERDRVLAANAAAAKLEEQTRADAAIEREKQLAATAAAKLEEQARAEAAIERERQLAAIAAAAKLEEQARADAAIERERQLAAIAAAAKLEEQKKAEAAIERQRQLAAIAAAAELEEQKKAEAAIERQRQLAATAAAKLEEQARAEAAIERETQLAAIAAAAKLEEQKKAEAAIERERQLAATAAAAKLEEQARADAAIERERVLAAAAAAAKLEEQTRADAAIERERVLAATAATAKLEEQTRVVTAALEQSTVTPTTTALITNNEKFDDLLSQIRLQKSKVDLMILSLGEQLSAVRKSVTLN